MIVGLRCAVCFAEVDIGQPFTWTCPRASTNDPHHLLQFVDDDVDTVLDLADDPNPFVRYRGRSAWWAFARARGLSDEQSVHLARSIAGEFEITPCEIHDGLSAAAGITVFAKNETCGVGGSHKARHLAGIMLHLAVAEQVGVLTKRAPLAISSCGNAALAAAVVASGQSWPLDVFVPTWMDAAFGDALRDFGVGIHRCERAGDGDAGDPAMAAFTAAVANGAIPFSVQGPANAWCLDTGRSIGWEIEEQLAITEAALAPIYVQVGGGALASSLGRGVGPTHEIRVVQAEGCAPLDRALHSAERLVDPGRHWSQIMRPWDNPHSLADGILDDETYDWLGIYEMMKLNGGRSIVASEADIERAYDLVNATGPATSATGAAGVAGLLSDSDAGRLESGPVVVVLSGVAR